MKRQIGIGLLAFVVTLMVIGGAVFFVWQVVMPQIRNLPFMPNQNIVPFHEHLGLDPNVPVLVFDGERVRDGVPPMVERRGGEYTVFLHLEFLREHLDPFLFWDEAAGVLFASTRYEMLEFTPGSARYLINGQSVQIPTPVTMVGSDIFIPADVVSALYPLVIEYRPTYNIVVVTRASVPQTFATVAVTSVDVRHWGNDRAPIATQIYLGDEVAVFPSDDTPPGFVLIRTGDGLLGYVFVNEIEGRVTDTISMSASPILSERIENTVHHPPAWPEGKSINMVWESVYSRDANWIHMESPLPPELNVVSPQWFRLDPEGTHINSVATREYVDWAHAQGVQVWPLVFDVDNARVSRFLPDRDARAHVVNQLVHYVDLLNLDGINIDFEHLSAPQGLYKIQFLRELAIPLRERGVVLSAAVKVPIPATMFYRRDLIGLTVDFVMVMTFDEHWSTSPVAGPVASMNWVNNGITNMLREVPADRLVMGLPFYNRIWREVVLDDDYLSQRSVGMRAARNFFEERDVEWEWDAEVGSYFGEVAVFEDSQTVIYRVWLEDVRSINTKMQIFVAHDLAGVAGWRRGLEEPEVWTTIAHFLR